MVLFSNEWSNVILAIKQYIVSLIISHSQNPELMEREKVYVNKLNIILVQVRTIVESKKNMRIV